MTGLLIAIVWFGLIGLAVERLLGDIPRWLAGAGACGLLLFLLCVAHVPFVIAIGVVGIAAIVVIATRRAPERAPNPPPSLADALIAIPLVIVLAYTLVAPLHDYDGCAFWMLKAKAIAHEQAIDGPYFHDRTSSALRNHYPLLIPLDAAVVMTIRRSLDDHNVYALYALLFAAFVLEVRRRAGPWCAALLAWIPQLATAPEGGAISAYCDVALAAFVAMALFDLADERPLRFGFWTACVVLTKDEGLPFAAILLVIAAFVLRKRIASALAPVAIAVIALFVWRSRIPRTDEEDLFGLLRTLPQRLGRLPDAVAQFAKYFVQWSDWGLLWIAVLAAIALLLCRRRWRPVAMAGGIIAGMCAVYVAVFMVTAWNLPDLLKVSAGRLITQFAGPAIFLISESARSR